MRKYGEILDDPNEIISVERLVWLFKSVYPKINSLISESNRLFDEKWSDIGGKILRMDRSKQSQQFKERIDIFYRAKMDKFVRVNDNFRDITITFAEKLDSELLVNRMELLREIVEAGRLVPSGFDLLRDVDVLEDEIRACFQEVYNFLDHLYAIYENKERREIVLKILEDET
jgi:hypothetical protein